MCILLRLVLGLRCVASVVVEEIGQIKHCDACAAFLVAGETFMIRGVVDAETK